MRKKNIFRLVFLTAFIALLWSCRNEDFAKGEKDPQRNNADFFKHQSSNQSKNGTDYVRILEDYNKETDFLSKMPDQKGMPIWEKMYAVETEKGAGIMIPLSHDNESMSSILFATLDGKNAVTGVKDYDNTILQNTVYNQKISVENREKFFFTFMFMDNRTFGNEHFTAIPNDLFVGNKYEVKHGMMGLRDFTPSSKVTVQQSGKLLIVETCVTVLHCTHHAPGICDACSECQTTTCTQTIMGTADDPFPTTPGGGGPTGGGGCNDCTPGGWPPSGPNVPENPCGGNTVSSVFYRPAPGCGGGTIPDVDDQCERAEQPVSNANNILEASTIATEKKSLEDHAKNDFTEYGMAIVSTGTSIIAQDPYSNNNPQNPGTVTIIFPTIGDVLASAHTHPSHGAAPPSVKDLYSTINESNVFPTYQASFVFAHNGTKYAFVITDRVKALAFLAAHPFAENTTDGGAIFNEFSEIGIDFIRIYKDYGTGRLPSFSGNDQNDGMESAYAYILDKYDAGISIAKTDDAGNLKALKSVSFKHTIPASGGKKITGYKAVPCP